MRAHAQEYILKRDVAQRKPKASKKTRRPQKKQNEGLKNKNGRPQKKTKASNETTKGFKKNKRRPQKNKKSAAVRLYVACYD